MRCSFPSASTTVSFAFWCLLGYIFVDTNTLFRSRCIINQLLCYAKWTLLLLNPVVNAKKSSKSSLFARVSFHCSMLTTSYIISSAPFSSSSSVMVESLLSLLFLCETIAVWWVVLCLCLSLLEMAPLYHKIGITVMLCWFCSSDKSAAMYGNATNHFFCLFPQYPFRMPSNMSESTSRFP